MRRDRLRLSGGNDVACRAGGALRDDAPGSPPPDPPPLRRLEHRFKAWTGWEAGEDVSDDEPFGPIPDDDV